nr:hypothetical protein [Bacteroidota bacterium]
MIQIKIIPILLFACLGSTIKVMSQSYFDIYQGANVNLITVDNNTNPEKLIKDAVILFPNDGNKLKLIMKLPISIVDSSEIQNAALNTKSLPLQLSITIDRNQIQSSLTSVEPFIAKGQLSINDIVLPVEVKYIPVASGPDEDGDFNINLVTSFNPADFNITQFSGERIIIKVSNSYVNRI